MIRSLVPLLALLALLLGCSGPETRTSRELSPSRKPDPWDDVPLLPRQTAKEQWESRRKPLPPLPERRKPELAEASGAEVSESADMLSAPAEPAPESAQGMLLAGEPTGGDLVTIPPVAEPSAPSDPEFTPSGWLKTPDEEKPGELSGTQPNEPLLPANRSGEPYTPTLDQVSPEGFPELVRLHQGRILLVNFWGIDCGPCVEELPAIERLQREFRSAGLDVVLVNSDIKARWPEVERFIQTKGITCNCYLKAPGPDTAFRSSMDPDYGADPFTLIFDRQGRKVATVADALRHEEWKGIVSAVLRDQPVPITKPDVIRSFK